MKTVYGLAWYESVNGLFYVSLWNCVTPEMVCFPKRILHNRWFEHSACRWQFCIRVGCSQVWWNSGCHLYTANSKSWVCGFCRSYHLCEYYYSRQRVFSVTHSSSRSSFLSSCHGSLIPTLWLQSGLFKHWGLAAELKCQALCFGMMSVRAAGLSFCPACAENQASPPSCILYLTQQMNCFSWSQASRPSPPPCLFETLFDFAFLPLGLECWSQCHWPFRQEMAFPSSEGVMLLWLHG